MEAVGDFVRRLHRLQWQRLTTRHAERGSSRCFSSFRGLSVPPKLSAMACLKHTLISAGCPGVFEIITGLN